MKRILTLILLCTLLLTTGCAAKPSGAEPTAAPAPAMQSQVGFYFDTVVTATLYQPQSGLMDDIWAACSRYEKLLSKTIEGSDVHRINNAGGQAVTVDPETWEILRRAKEINRMTGGAFSITIAPISAMWDFTGGTQRMPTEEERLAALPLVDDGAIILGDNYTVTLPAGAQIDLGGIAKGYIADKVAELARGRADGVILSLGGNVYVLGHKPDGSVFNVGVQDPDGGTNTPLAVVSTTDISVVTSGIYERKFEKDGVLYHHILDPKTGLPSQSDLASATVVAASSMDADALATALIVMGKEQALQLMRQQGIEGLLITRDRQAFGQQSTDTYQLKMLVDIPVQ